MFEDIKNFFHRDKKNPKGTKSSFSPFVIFILVLAIIIPTLFAIFYAHFYEKDESFSSTTVEILLYDEAGVLLSSNKVAEADAFSSEFIRPLYGIIQSKYAIEEATNSLEAPNFSIVFNHNESSERYNCYFTAQSEKSYICDQNAQMYSINEIYYKEFLNTDFAESIYPEAKPPRLITGDGEEILPFSASWSYKRQNGDAFSSKSCTTTSEISNYKIAGSISVAFESAPDICTVHVTDADGTDIFKGPLSDLPFVTLETGETVGVKLNAIWEKRDGRNFYGDANYDFQVTLVNRAELSISSTSVTAGEFILLSIKNADELEKIIYSSSASTLEDDLMNIKSTSDDEAGVSAISELYSIRPVFVPDGKYARAIIPFPLALPSGSFSFSLSYGASTQSFTVNVKHRDVATQYPFTKNSAELVGVLSSTELEAFKNALSSIQPPNQAMVFIREAFASPTSCGFSAGYSYGSTVDASDNLVSFEAAGNEFLSTLSGGQSVKALNTGSVVGVGYCVYLGNYVVIEHGMGLRTWYCGLSTLDVAVGSVVVKGDVIGKSGTTSLTSADGVLILCTVYDKLIDPASVFDKDIIYNK